MCRRSFLFRALAASLLGVLPSIRVSGQTPAPDHRLREFMDRAFAMKQLAEHNGDQPYGAVIVKDGAIISEAPSRVVSNADWTAHAEREAVREAIRKIGTERVRGATIYSSSRPCAMCQAALHQAGVARMIHGERLTDAGAPQAR
jgi:tRNA(Arg) A34 adenosine deaminase TadA